MLSDIGQIKNAAEIIAGEKDKSELGVTAVDDNTLQVELNVPVSYFTSLMYFPTFYPVNEEFFTSCGDTFATSPETVLSNGAFVLDSYQPAATAFHLTKNADYYDTDRVKLSGLSYQVIQDSQQALMSYQTGALDTTLVNGEQVMFSIPTAIFTEAFLSFVGLGIPVPQCSLGSLISEGFNSFTTHPYQIIPPIVVMALLMLSFNLVADGLREALDPKLKEM